jgi:hypothetical protein
MNKLFSGRYLFTVICAFVFAYLCITGSMDKNDAMQLIMMVAIFYFNRNEKQGVEK